MHWANAVPFMVLMLTGGIILASKFHPIESGIIGVIKAVHKVFAFVWIAALPTVVLFDRKVHQEHIRAMLSWGMKDLVWLVQSFRALYNSQVCIPPSGRFNTGQKINACLVMVYFFGFSATGLVMFWKPAVLFPWHVHFGILCAAISTVAGHLFLALINPSTRVARAVIFHGRSPLDYVRKHHPLALPNPAPAHSPSLSQLLSEVIRSKTETGILSMALAAAVAGAFALSDGRLGSARNWCVTWAAKGIEPAGLSIRHRTGPVAESCTQCHSWTRGIVEAKCEKCHQDIRQRMSTAMGYHGTLKGDCVNCHKEHPGASQSIVLLDRKQFDHNLTAFKREGKHATLECDACHKQRRTPTTPGIYYTGLKFNSCTDCHPDPHAGQFVAECESCHSTAGWTRATLALNHDRFPLEGKHEQTACEGCHVPTAPGAHLAEAQFRGLKSGCTDCHKDPHLQKLGTFCVKCHTTSTSWKRIAASDKQQSE